MSADAFFEAVIFDLDGTLLDSRLDFDAMRLEINASITSGVVDGPLLEALPELSTDDRSTALRILAAHERRGIDQAELYPGARETLESLREAGLRTAILTRNSRENLEEVIRRFELRVDATRTRDDGPSKPDPDPIFALCRSLDAAPERTIGVGDYVFDLEAARAAGSLAILVRRPGNEAFAAIADRVIEQLAEILPIASGIDGSSEESP